MRRNGTSKGPLSPWATAAVVLGALVAVGIAGTMASSSKPHRTEDTQQLQERIAALEAELEACNARQKQPEPSSELQPWESEHDPKPKSRPSRTEEGLPPTRLPLKDDILIPDDIIEETQIRREGWESEWSLPPLRLDSRDELSSYLRDPAPDGEVMPGPVNNNAK